MPTTPPTPDPLPVAAPVEPPPERERRVQVAALRRHLQGRLLSAPAPWLHEEIARRMDERLGMIRMQPASILDWWSARGGGADLLRQRYPKAAVHRVEPPSRAGVAASSPWWRRWAPGAKAAPVRWDDAAHWAWPEGPLAVDPVAATPWPPAQLLWANMMLHWADHPAPVLADWFDRLDEGGMLMFSCFGPDTARELAHVFGAKAWGPVGAAFMDMHDIGDALVSAGFRDPVMDMERLTLTWADPLAALAELRSWGGNVAPQRGAGLRTPAWRRELIEAWHQSSPAGEGVSLTIEVVYGHALRGPARVPVTATAAISLDTMRQMVRRRDV